MHYDTVTRLAKVKFAKFQKMAKARQICFCYEKYSQIFVYKSLISRQFFITSSSKMIFLSISWFFRMNFSAIFPKTIFQALTRAKSTWKVAQLDPTVSIEPHRYRAERKGNISDQKSLCSPCLLTFKPQTSNEVDRSLTHVVGLVESIKQHSHQGRIRRVKWSFFY